MVQDKQQHNNLWWNYIKHHWLLLKQQRPKNADKEFTRNWRSIFISFMNGPKTRTFCIFNLLNNTAWAAETFVFFHWFQNPAHSKAVGGTITWSKDLKKTPPLWQIRNHQVLMHQIQNPPGSPSPVSQSNNRADAGRFLCSPHSVFHLFMPIGTKIHQCSPHLFFSYPQIMFFPQTKNVKKGEKQNDTLNGNLTGINYMQLLLKTFHSNSS